MSDGAFEASRSTDELFPVVYPDLREMYGWLAEVEQLRGEREAAARDRAVASAR